MSNSVEFVKLEMVIAQRTTGTLDIVDWTSRYPEFREDLLEYWTMLLGTDDGVAPAEAAHTAVPLTPVDLAIYSDAARDACLAVTFGAGMLRREAPSELEQLGADLELARCTVPMQPPKSKNFSRAVVYTWIVRSLAEQRPQVSRLAPQKVSFLLEQALDLGLFDSHRRNRLGPYDATAKYRDAEPIAKTKGWLRVQGASLLVTEQAGAIDRFCARYLRDPDAAARLVATLARCDDRQLEVLATVLPLAREICVAGGSPTAGSVLNAIGDSAEWKGKLTKDHFAPQRVEEAIVMLNALRLISS